MTHREQRIYLIQALLAKDPRYADITIPADEQAQSDLLRSLMNVRLPKPISLMFSRYRMPICKRNVTAAASQTA